MNELYFTRVVEKTRKTDRQTDRQTETDRLKRRTLCMCLYFCARLVMADLDGLAVTRRRNEYEDMGEWCVLGRPQPQRV